MRDDVCEDCGAPDPRTSLDGVWVCDDCYNKRTAAMTGLRDMPRPPEDIELVGPDGRGHRLSYRIRNAVVGIEVQLEEQGVPIGEGYEFSVLGSVDADVDGLLAAVRQRAEEGIGRCYLKPAGNRSGWRLAGDEVAGRFLWDETCDLSGHYNVVVDGRTLSWEEFGRTFESFEGWRFRLVIEDTSDDVRPDADVIEIEL